MLAIPEVSVLDMAFGARAMEFMPAEKDIPKDYPNRKKWEKVMGDWFFVGLKNEKWTPKAGVETAKALAAVKTVLGSYAPKHEHKAAAVAFMLSEWFEDVTYEPGKLPV